MKSNFYLVINTDYKSKKWGRCNCVSDIESIDIDKQTIFADFVKENQCRMFMNKYALRLGNLLRNNTTVRSCNESSNSSSYSGSSSES